MLVALFVAGLVSGLPGGYAADPEDLAPGEGLLLLRVTASERQKISRFSFTQFDTGEMVTIRMPEFHAAGAGAWLALVKAPPGRYFWSEYETALSGAVEASRDLERLHRRKQPGGPDDTFEIVAGVVNYVGDWTMRTTDASRRRLDPLVHMDKATLERYVADYPALANRYPIYLCMLGKKAISLDELARIIESQSPPR